MNLYPEILREIGARIPGHAVCLYPTLGMVEIWRGNWPLSQRMPLADFVAGAMSPTRRGWLMLHPECPQESGWIALQDVMTRLAATAPRPQAKSRGGFKRKGKIPAVA
ncbi:MAG TPA: hypothetical protein VNQ78_18760 [Paracoccus sp. (in: a-proteobacteria)]|uniref:hypothetical protein n=1 Tax=Paracoccus sp. TaxID=267 RepID=UPI002C9C722E|nr:hypothetical protein [Paracoccus sp. (in: a-proteobacteria)]HWL58699.1 hypothetical protein [Paracoccus sp. (in: a-proteobacteria)]